MCATSSKRRTAMAQHTSYSNRWTSVAPAHPAPATLVRPARHCAPRRLGAQTPSEPDSLPRSLRPQQRTSCTGDAGQARQGPHGGCGARHHARATPGSHDLGATPEAGVQSFRILLTPLAYVPVGHIDIEICKSCGGHVKIIACIEDPVVIEKILTHLDRKDASHAARRLPPSRAPPQASLFA